MSSPERLYFYRGFVLHFKSGGGKAGYEQRRSRCDPPPLCNGARHIKGCLGEGAPDGARHRQAQARGAALPRLVLPLPVLPVLCYRLGGGFPARRRSGFRPARRKRAGLTTEKRRNRRFRAQTRRGNSAKHLLSVKRSAARQLHAQTRIRTGG